MNDTKQSTGKMSLPKLTAMVVGSMVGAEYFRFRPDSVSPPEFSGR